MNSDSELQVVSKYVSPDPASCRQVAALWRASYFNFNGT
jgi:hypothetical protein